VSQPLTNADYCSCQNHQKSHEEGLESFLPISIKAVRNFSAGSSLFPTVVAHFGLVAGGSAVRSGGVRGANRAVKFDVKTFNIVNMDVASLVTTGGDSRPSVGSEPFGFEGERPFGIHENQFVPAHGENLKGIGNDNSFIAKGDLWFNDKGVNIPGNSQRNDNFTHNRFRIGTVVSGPREKGTHNEGKGAQSNAGFGAKDFWVTHSRMISHDELNPLSNNLEKAVK